MSSPSTSIVIIIIHCKFGTSPTVLKAPSVPVSRPVAMELNVGDALPCWICMMFSNGPSQFQDRLKGKFHRKNRKRRRLSQLGLQLGGKPPEHHEEAKVAGHDPAKTIPDQPNMPDEPVDTVGQHKRNTANITPKGPEGRVDHAISGTISTPVRPTGPGTAVSH